MKKILFITSGIVLLVVVGVASFYGGRTYQRNQTEAIQARFFATRGLANTGGTTGTGSFTQGSFPRGLQGTIKSIQGNVMTLSTAQNVVTVNLSSSTIILKAVSGTNSDLATGATVTVTGQRDSSGNENATQVLILKPAQ
jgi:hypothetical protein